MNYYLKVVAATQGRAECQMCGQVKDTTLWLADVENAPEEIAAVQVCDACRDKVLVSWVELDSWWATYLKNETREEAQARAVGYLDMIRKHTQQITGLYKRLEDAEEKLKRHPGNPPVAPAPVVA